MVEVAWLRYTARGIVLVLVLLTIAGIVVSLNK
jgi:hypothetical protein